MMWTDISSCAYCFYSFLPEDRQLSAHLRSHRYPGSPNLNCLDPHHSLRCRTCPSPLVGKIWGRPPPL